MTQEGAAPADNRDRRLSKAAGFDDHLIKPADVSALQAVLEAA